eukprot:m51a1_g12397 putative intraflagellar transport protein 46 homolog (396) ;mRNA; f:679895-681472
MSRQPMGASEDDSLGGAGGNGEDSLQESTDIDADGDGDQGRVDSPPQNPLASEGVDEDEGEYADGDTPQGRGLSQRIPPGSEGDAGRSEEEEDDNMGGGGGGGNAGRFYNKADYAHLDVSGEVRELFEYIDLCKPTDVELETKFKPFIPEYIPAVGDIDPFLKPPRPDKAPAASATVAGGAPAAGQAAPASAAPGELLGMTVLDELGKQSDPAVVEMILRQNSRRSNLPSMDVRSIECADKKPKEILAWVDRIAQFHASTPPPNVSYSKPMPPIESLMQEWPPEFEDLLERAQLPSADIDVELKTYARVICALLDIPVYGNNLIESLHVLFTLYSAFKENQHFGANNSDGATMTNSMAMTGGPMLGSTAPMGDPSLSLTAGAPRESEGSGSFGGM